MGKNSNKTAQDTQKKEFAPKQIVALAGVILLVLLYLTTLVVAIVDTSASGRMFWMCLFATVAVPILIWIYTWISGRLSGRSSVGDPETDTEAGEKQRDLP